MSRRKLIERAVAGRIQSQMSAFSSRLHHSYHSRFIEVILVTTTPGYGWLFGKLYLGSGSCNFLVIGDANWQALAGKWNEQQLLDFLFTVGYYATVTWVMCSTGVQRAVDLRELAERNGAPPS